MHCITNVDYTQIKKKTIQILKSKRGQINEKHKTAYFFRQGIKTYC